MLTQGTAREFAETLLQGKIENAYLNLFRFDDPSSSLHSLQRIAATLSGNDKALSVLTRLLLQMSQTSAPDIALVNFEHFLNNQKENKTLLRDLAAEPRSIDTLLILFSGSQFLTTILLRFPQSFAMIKDWQRLAQPKIGDQFFGEAKKVIANKTGRQHIFDALREYQQLEMLKIGASDLFGLWDLQTVTAQLSRLAISLVRICLLAAAKELGMPSGGLAVIAMGKLGGRELNYSSDIDLLFVVDRDDPQYQKLGQLLIKMLAETTAGGFLYRVDMRLRPWGKVGKLVPTLEETLDYFNNNARMWEKQAFVKARMIAGDDNVGLILLRSIRPLIFQLEAEAVRCEAKMMKAKAEEKLKRRNRDQGEIKSGKGSIREIEFICQYLQIKNGAAHPEVRTRNTLDCLARLTGSGLLGQEDYTVLSSGYTFLRSVEHHLQIMHYNQTHSIPKDQLERHVLARRLGFDGKQAASDFWKQYRQHSKAIRARYERIILTPEKFKSAENATDQITDSFHGPTKSPPAGMDAAYAAAFSETEIRLHKTLLDKISDENPVEIDARKEEEYVWTISIVGHDYFGELSLICGLLFVFGLDIVGGSIFTYEPEAVAPPDDGSPPPSGRNRRQMHRRAATGHQRKKIIDVLRCIQLDKSIPPDWQGYKHELKEMVHLLRKKKQAEAHGYIAKKFAETLSRLTVPDSVLLPVNISVDNTASENYTVLFIDATNTHGFFYELTNALALNGIYIARVVVTSVGNRIHDTLYVNDAEGKKILDVVKRRMLRSAIVLVKHFTHLLPQSPNPEAALLNFREFIAQLFLNERWPNELASIASTDVLKGIARLLGVSEFLWDDFLRMQHANLFPLLHDLEALNESKNRKQLRDELQERLKNATSFAQQKHALNEFKDREMFRIDMRYIQQIAPEFWQFSKELSDLADVVIDNAVTLCFENLQKEIGRPLLQDQQVCHYCVAALGKCGGKEMGFASDIELMFVYEGDGVTDGNSGKTNEEFFSALVHLVIRMIHAKRKGIFEIDLRLRPYGKSGNLVVEFDSFRTYFAPGGPAWYYERQALVRMRNISGDPSFCARLMDARDACIFTGEPFDIAAMRAMRERQIRQLVPGGTLNAKFSPGCLADIEFLVQGLQIMHGHDIPELRQTNTRSAFYALAKTGLLDQIDFERLSQAHTFMRRLIEALRMVRGNARDLTVPSPQAEEFLFLARRLGYNPNDGRLQKDLTNHTAYVKQASERLLTETQNR